MFGPSSKTEIKCVRKTYKKYHNESSYLLLQTGTHSLFQKSEGISKSDFSVRCEGLALVVYHKVEQFLYKNNFTPLWILALSHSIYFQQCETVHLVGSWMVEINLLKDFFFTVTLIILD